MLRALSIILPIDGLIIISVIFLYHSTGWSDDSSGSIMYYNRLSPSAETNPPRQKPRGPVYQRTAPAKRLTDSPAYHEENLFGFPIHQDPLFDENPRPSWAPMIEDRQVYDRPTYDRPDYDAPIVREDPIRKPMYEKPLYELPIDDKPKYDRDYDQAPAYMKPTLAEPVYRAPNYVIKPELAPAYDHLPTVDRGELHYDRPEYTVPVYNPQEYKAPREVLPPYIAPPE